MDILMEIVRLGDYGNTLLSETEAAEKIAQAARYNKLTETETIEKLDKCKLQYGTGLYYEPVYIASKKLIDEVEKRIAEKRAQTVYVKCSCGHTVPKSQVMSASMGTSCPDCYDRMSE